MNSSSSLNSITSATRVDFSAAEPEVQPTQTDIFAATIIRVKASAQFENAATPPDSRHCASRRFECPGNDPQQRALARAVAAHQAEDAATGDSTRHIVERSEPAMPQPPAQPSTSMSLGYAYSR
jgi:hypothetical protein